MEDKIIEIELSNGDKISEEDGTMQEFNKNILGHLELWYEVITKHHVTEINPKHIVTITYLKDN